MEDVGNWRPITLGNVLMRLHAKVRDERLRANIKWNDWQKGLVPVDRCFENVNILQGIIKQQRKKRKEYNIVFLDIAKAFDSVSHQPIRKGLARKGIPPAFIEGIMDMYKRLTTKIRVGSQTTRTIDINSGLKQGCPLSPLLFNLIMDELLERLKKKKIGIQIGEELITDMAFANDLVLATKHNSHITIALKECELLFMEKGLKVNAKKCLSMRVLPVKGKKLM